MQKDKVLSLKTVPSKSEMQEAQYSCLPTCCTGPATFRKVQFSITAKFRLGSVLKIQMQKIKLVFTVRGGRFSNFQTHVQQKFWSLNSAKQQCLNTVFTLFNSYSICCQIASVVFLRASHQCSLSMSLWIIKLNV